MNKTDKILALVELMLGSHQMYAVNAEKCCKGDNRMKIQRMGVSMQLGT